MSAAEKKFVLDLPLKVVLTEDGASHFISNKKKLLRFRLADNAEEYGISMEHFSPMSIQNMILVDYISKIEISMSEFVSRRQEIMDLSKVIVYSILYKQFDRQIFSQMIECDCVRHHNRTNPSQLIDEKTRIPEKQLRNILSFKDNAIQQSRQAILEPVWKSIMSNPDYTPEEKNVYLLMTEKFLNRLNLMNWYIITKFYKTEGFSQIMSILRQSLAQYMDKSKVAEYISVMVMELALNSENSNMRKEARILYQGIDNADTLIYDPDIRKKIVEELARKHEFVSLSWKIGGGSTSIGKQGALNITLYNKEDEFQEVKENIESKLSADLHKRSLIDFYRQMPEGEEGTDLGLYYLSYLDDACKKVNVKFESLVNQFTTSDLTVINLKFNF
ncbi:MAG: hypothetical protein J6X11_07155 [Treponema sp.]|nr:hypothetical protein [Treponema sp.]MBR4385845.1 hypothetical protein [Treponema sp.]